MHAAGRLGWSAVIAAIACALTGCGGGGTSASTSSFGSGTTTAVPQITTEQVLPPTLRGQSYTTTLVASGGKPPYTWAIAPVSATALFVDGLTIDAKTGVLSGTVNWAGTAGFTATVTDSAMVAAVKGFYITGYSPLQNGTASTAAGLQYGYFIGGNASFFGGLPPLTYSVVSGQLPNGIRLNPQTGTLSGTPLTAGTFQWTVRATDSFLPAETATQQFSGTVAPPQLFLANSLPSRWLANRPFSARMVATGGIPPYTYKIAAGNLPPGTVLSDANSGTVSGTPTTVGNYSALGSVTDSATPPATNNYWYYFNVVQPKGRNDSVATATTLAGDGFFSASISPYQDPPQSGTETADTDFFKLTSIAGTTVHIETNAKRNNAWNPLDTVLEILDANGTRLSACRQPGDTGTAYASECINDDMSASPHIQDSALDLLVPGTANAQVTFYVHVLDWSGRARPDMVYTLQISGVRGRLAITNAATLPFAFHGMPYYFGFNTTPATGAVTFAVTAGTLPDGITLSPSGILQGTPTTVGTWNFSIQASDSGNPAQTATASFTLQVIDPLSTNLGAALPDACVNAPYSFQVTAAGGIAPYSFYFIFPQPGITMDRNTGAISGTPTVTGTYVAYFSLQDSALHVLSKYVSMTVKQCP